MIGKKVLISTLRKVSYLVWFVQVNHQFSEVESEIILDETITIRFDASLERDMPWEFMPVERQVEVKFGETALAFYEAYNPTSRPIAGSASYNVTPYGAGSFFNKITHLDHLPII